MNTLLEIDIDGDGTVDGVVSAQTDTVIPTSVIVTEDAQVDIQIEELQSGSQTTATRLSRAPQSPFPAGQVAGATISVREQWYYEELLKILESVAELLALIEEQYEK